jgi:hypothetical protein
MSYGTVQAEKMTTESGYSLGAGNASSFKNRIINGGMVIDQRNAGASITVTNTTAYPVDRWPLDVYGSTGAISGQRSTVAPPGFTNSLLLTVVTTRTAIAADFFAVGQRIEGFNAADLGWGTANAQTITLSFWARASVTGNYAVSLRNNDASRSYVTSITINSANTYEYKTLTIVGDTTGTWGTTNGIGINLSIDLGTGSTYQTATANAWQAGNFVALTSGVRFVANAGATLYITGVQLEVGTVATSFDTRSIGTELALCQRYFISYRNTSGENEMAGLFGSAISTTGCSLCLSFPVEMRTRPSLAISSLALADGVNPVSAVTSFGNRTDITSTKMIFFEVFVASGLTQFRPYYGRFVTSSSGSVQISAEL